MARIKHVGVRLTAAEFLRVALAADALGMRPAAWVRHQAIRAADPAAAGPAAEDPARFQAPAAASPASLAHPATPDAKLTRTAGTRFTDQQFAALAAHALACGLPLAAVLRQAALGVTPVARRPLAHAAIVALNRVGNNLNQLVHLAHTGVLLPPDLHRAVAAVLRQVLALRDAFLDADRADADPADADRTGGAEPTAAAEPPEPPE